MKMVLTFIPFVLTFSSIVSPAWSFICPAKFGTFPDHEDCHAYWMCDNSVSRHLMCPKDFHFDPIAEACALGGDCDKTSLRTTPKIETTTGMPTISTATPTIKIDTTTTSATSMFNNHIFHLEIFSRNGF